MMTGGSHIDTRIDILIDSQGQLKLSDFGAAKILAKGQKTMGRTTMNMNVNSLAGTPMYMVSVQDRMNVYEMQVITDWGMYV